MATKNDRRYGQAEAKAGIDARLPEIECWENQFPDYEIMIEVPEYTSVCPKTGLPDFGTIKITYVPDQSCVELKSFKEYLLAYRNLGIFYENATNRILRDFVKACDPVMARVEGKFTPRGGISTSVAAEYRRKAEGGRRKAEAESRRWKAESGDLKAEGGG